LTHVWSEDGTAMERRLKSLEDILIHGGGDIADGRSVLKAEHCNIIREKLRREKLNAEEKQRRLEEANQSCSSETTAASALYNVFASAHEEIVAKTSALEQLRGQNEHLRHEISDIQATISYESWLAIDNNGIINKWFNHLFIIPLLSIANQLS